MWHPSTVRGAAFAWVAVPLRCEAASTVVVRSIDGPRQLLRSCLVAVRLAAATALWQNLQRALETAATDAGAASGMGSGTAAEQPVVPPTDAAQRLAVYHGVLMGGGC